MSYEFRPPIAYQQPMSVDDGDFLWSRVRFDVAATVVKTTTGGYRQEVVHDPDRDDIAVKYYGGHVYSVSDDEAAALTAAGYGSCLTAVPA